MSNPITFDAHLKALSDDDLIFIYLCSDMLPNDGSVEKLWAELEARQLKLPATGNSEDSRKARVGGQSLSERIEKGEELSRAEWSFLHGLQCHWRPSAKTPEQALINCIFCESLSFEEFVKRGQQVLARWRVRRQIAVDLLIRSLRSQHGPGVWGYLPLDYYDGYSHPQGHTNGWENTVRAYEEDR